jgi:hypothetical protein
LKEGFAS